MNFTIEPSGHITFESDILNQSSARVLFLCAICSREIPFIEKALTLGRNFYNYKICRSCTKDLARFVDDNRTMILSM